jgi:hypothetical protein
VNLRLRAVCDLGLAEAREGAGLHEYDGQVQDLSPSGVASALARLGGLLEPDPHDEAHLAAFEESLRVFFGELEEHRRNPLVHLWNLDLACYDREYAPPEIRGEARRRHLAGWPDGVDAALASLDRVPAPVAEALLPAVRGLASGVEATDRVGGQALAAHARLVGHLEGAANDGPPDPSLGGTALTRLLSAHEAMPVDLGDLADRAEAERARLQALLAEACARVQPGVPTTEVVQGLLRDHPDISGVLAEAQAQVDEVVAFTQGRKLVPDLDGECVVGPAPPSRRWAVAMMSWAAPHEDDAPSRYYITPPARDWPAEQQEEWLALFSRTTLLPTTVHEVAPGHFAHGRALRRVKGDVRRTLFSPAFTEGWAHYAEELLVEEGFRADDPRYPVGVALEALVRVTRLAVSIGLHTGDMTMDEAVRRFREDAFLRGPAAVSEAARATFDPTYGQYTWGKLEILALRDEARARWGSGYSHPRFHAALLALGAPPLGLMGAAVSDLDHSS